MEIYNNDIYNISKDSNIILIGMTCSGKTTLGKYLSDKLDYNFIDTDLLIEEKENMTITKIFTTKGEGYFREKEKELLNELLNVKKSVISTGGGMPIFFNNMNLLKKIGIVIFLNTDINEIIKRANRVDDRPLINTLQEQEDNESTKKYNKKNKNGVSEDILIKNKEKETLILDMYEKRISIYNTAHINIYNENMTIEQLGNHIVQKINLFIKAHSNK